MAKTVEQQKEWTPMLGLLRALVGSLWRAVIGLIIWGALVWLATPFLNIAPMHLAWFALLALLLALPGAGVGHGLSKGLNDRAGFVILVVSVIPVVFGWAAIYAGIEIAGTFRELEEWRPMFTMGVTGVFATLWIIKSTLLVP